jgi:hypothetical protein
MLTPNHPEDERLAAFAGADPEATGDPALSGHLDRCERCRIIVDELGALRSALAELPDLRPMRPLRLLPAVEPAEPGFAERLGGLVRRVFMPVLTAGAALALVGAVGTVTPAFSGGGDSGTADIFEDVGDALTGGGADGAGDTTEMTDEGDAPAAEDRGGAVGEQSPPATDPYALEGFGAGEEDDETPVPQTVAMDSPEAAGETPEARPESPRDSTASEPLSAERSPWPMVLFSGVALMAGAVLLRWILAPR